MANEIGFTPARCYGHDSYFRRGASIRIPKKNCAGRNINAGPYNLGEVDGSNRIEKQRHPEQEPPCLALFRFPRFRKCPYGPRADDDTQELIVAVWQRQSADKCQDGYQRGKATRGHAVEFLYTRSMNNEVR